MADYALNIPNETMKSAFQEIYTKIPRQTITPTAISLAEKSRSEMLSETEASLRPYLDLSATQREQAAIQGRAELDADAYSRGMGSSTWLTDKKSRESMAAQTDIANMKAQYAASIADSVNKQLQNYQANKLAVDQTNVSNKLAADQFNANQEEAAYTKAYQILMNMWDKGMFATPGSGGSGSDGDGGLKFDLSGLVVSKSSGASGSVGGSAAKNPIAYASGTNGSLANILRNF